MDTVSAELSSELNARLWCLVCSFAGIVPPAATLGICLICWGSIEVASICTKSVWNKVWRQSKQPLHISFVWRNMRMCACGTLLTARNWCTFPSHCQGYYSVLFIFLCPGYQSTASLPGKWNPEYILAFFFLVWWRVIWSALLSPGWSCSLWRSRVLPSIFLAYVSCFL